MHEPINPLVFISIYIALKINTVFLLKTAHGGFFGFLAKFPSFFRSPLQSGRFLESGRN
jgi:hypothetical protein